MTRRRPLKPVTKKYLGNAARYYLEQRATSVAHLRRILTRKAARRLEVHEGDSEEVAGWIEEVLEEMIRLGALNDELFVEQRARSMHRSGRSTRAIRSKLFEKGLGSSAIDVGIASLLEEAPDADWVAACRHARRRGLGPFRRADREARPERELASLARAGFSYALARRILESEDREELEEVIFAAR